ncbi:MAG: VWA domain-containing protein [Gammaproteobacteria bacterium]|nr:VWA domain-containing protein [Gammaproteobacteria bacterium]
MLVAMLLGGAAWADAVPGNSDVRILIDISGSMRQNDPNNLRRPALRMLAGLLQPGTRAGVWTFARWVNNLVPVAEVDQAWRQRTQALSKQIASPGQFTNIEEVLDRASRDWHGKPTTHARHLVLLTDGMVDVSKQAADNAQSRARILDTLLPRLKDAGVKVHTIALSARADHALMKQLAGETGGWYQQVEQADRLQRVFLKMFETVGTPDALPLDDNRFTIDGSISEATVLVFSKPESPPVVLRSPTGDEYSDSDLTAGIAWFRDQGYNLITIDKPAKGEWSLQADIDPDNRVMIVTDLKLRTSEVPAHVAVGESVQVAAWLSNQDKLVDRQAFLRLLELRAAAVTADGSNPLGLNDAGSEGDETAGDGRYAMRFADNQARDAVEVLVTVDSPTFMREKRFRVAVHELADASVGDGPDGPVLTLQTSVAVLQPGVQVEAWQQDGAGERQSLPLGDAGDGRWQVALADPALPVYAAVSGTSRLGNPVHQDLGPILAPGAEMPAPAVPPAAAIETPAEPLPAPEPPAVVDDAVAPPVAAPPPAEPADDAAESWLMPAALFSAVNLLLLVAAGTWWWLRRRRGGSDDDDIDLDALVGDSAADATATGTDAQEEAA